MTTQLPYEPPRFGAYPTAPPWATAEESPAPAAPEPFIATTFPQAVATVVEQHPAEPAMATAPATATTRPPSVIPIALLTCLFSVLGAILAAKRADAAARDGHPRNPYWVTFGMAMLVNTLMLTSLAMTLLLPEAVQ